MISEGIEDLAVNSTKQKLKTVHLIPIVILLLAAGCYSIEPFSYTSSFSVLVVDKNGKPLPGAFIPYSYEGDFFALVEAHSYVVEAGILVTDQNGQYRVPALFETHSLFKSGAKLAVWSGYCPTTHSMFVQDYKARRTHKIVVADNSNNLKAWADDLKAFSWSCSCWGDIANVLEWKGQTILPAQKKIRADLYAMLQSEQQLLNEAQRLLDEKNPDFLYDRGQREASQGNWDGAIVDYTKAINLRADYVDAYIGRGHAKKGKNDLSGALADCTKAIEFNPNSVSAYIARGNVEEKKGDLNGARADYTKALELSPDYAFGHVLRGQVECAQGDWDDALADFNKVVELHPGAASSYLNRGKVKKEKGDLDGAQADFKKAAELGSGHSR